MNLFAFAVLWVVKFIVFQRLFRTAAVGGTDGELEPEATERW